MAAPKSKSDLPDNAAKGKRFGIVVSRYHEELTSKLLDGAVSALTGLGASKSDITTVWVPGSFEIPLAARALANQSSDAVICLGVIIKGETSHDQFIAREVARGISQLALTTGIPVSFGVLTTQSIEQAEARCGGAKGHKGVEAAQSAVTMIRVIEDLQSMPTKKNINVGF
ncbi:MAG TPA: 6,7-dimethyl-8-ribityllumazine synthase [Elusimicrobiota bacterium]|nr:6,7-dimethyl-8-ribityllumazine synthase [Elusimicrobiota bacterium]